MSDTPRTDCFYNVGKSYLGVPSPNESLNFARELERELNDEIERGRVLRGMLEDPHKLQRENATLRDDCLRLARALGIEEQYRHLLPPKP